MKQLLALLSIAVLLGGTVAAGALHGRLSGRWGLNTAAQTAADRLAADFPTEIGNWQMFAENPLGKEVVETLQCPAYVSRVYKHEQTGDVATVAVILGPPGPISVHTPEICYSSRDFSIAGDRRKVDVPGSAGVTHAFWELPLQTNDVHALQSRVFYGWCRGVSWEAATMPRFSYGALTHLYKLQVAVTSNSPSQAKDFDAGRDFLSAFVKQLEPRLVAARTPGAIGR